MSGARLRFIGILALCGCSLALIYGWCGEATNSAQCEFVLSVPKTEWQPDEKVVATLLFKNKGSSPVTVVESWLPSGSEITRKYVQDGRPQEDTLFGGTLRGVTGEHYSAVRQPEEYVTVAPGGSLKTEVNLTSQLRNGQKEIPEGEYQVVLRYRYERSKEEATMSLFGWGVDANHVQLRVRGKRS